VSLIVPESNIGSSVYL